MKLNYNAIYKFKDSVDLFLTDEKFLTAYFMNSRHRKTFKVNKVLISLLELIDGKTKLIDIKKQVQRQFILKDEDVELVIQNLMKNRILTEIKEQNILIEQDFIRYSRQINYFSEFFDDEEKALKTQKKLLETKILIFGCGAIGGNIAIQLLMAGVRNLTLFDFDKVEISDCTRHLFFTENSIGTLKTEALKNYLLKIDREANIQTINESLQPTTEIEDYIKKANFVVNTLDEPYIGYTAAKISRICMKHNIPHFIGGGFDAHLSSTGEIIIPYVTPCVECYTRHFKESLKNWKPKKHPVKKRFREIGGLASQSLFSSSFACTEILKFLTGIIDMEKSFKVRGEFLFRNMGLSYLDIKKDPTCPICGVKK